MRQIESTTDGEDRVANGLCFQSPHVGSPMKSVLFIDRGIRRIVVCCSSDRLKTA